jgi:hypothetical protein
VFAATIKRLPETVLGNQSKQLQRRSLRMLLTSLPLAHQTRCHIQIAGENRLAAFPQAKLANFPGAQ